PAHRAVYAAADEGGSVGRINRLKLITRARRHMMSGLRLPGVLLLSMTAAGCSLAALGGQDDSRVRARYTKREVQIAMRDGVKLFTSIYLLKDTTRSCAIMLSRTPFGVAPYGPDAFKTALGPSKHFEEEGFIFV